MAIALEQDRFARFMKAGVIGPVAMDQARITFRRQTRKDLIGHLTARDMKAKLESRRGAGSSGTFIAYEELTRRVGMALRKLADKEGGEAQ